MIYKNLLLILRYIFVLNIFLSNRNEFCNVFVLILCTNLFHNFCCKLFGMFQKCIFTLLDEINLISLIRFLIR